MMMQLTKMQRALFFCRRQCPRNSSLPQGGSALSKCCSRRYYVPAGSNGTPSTASPLQLSCWYSGGRSSKIIIRSITTGAAGTAYDDASVAAEEKCDDSIAVGSNDDKTDIISRPYHGEEPFTNQQNSLLEYTQSILPNTSEYPIGTLSYAQIIQIANTIDRWTSSGEHRYLGAEQALRLMKRLIVERGGGRSLLTEEEKESIADGGGGTVKLRRNEDVTWDMYHIHPVIQYLNALYSGKEFVDRILSIVITLEEEYVNDDNNLAGTNRLELHYKDIIASLCDHRTPHATTAAEIILHRFETRLRQTSPQYHHPNPPGVETYNNIINCWKRMGGRASYPPDVSHPYLHHPNPASNLLTQMLHLYNSNPEDNLRIRPDFITFNSTISSLSKEQTDNYWRGKDVKLYSGKRCFEHLMSMLELYNKGAERCAPDLITFSTVLNTLWRGKDKGDEARAREILEVMLRLSGLLADGNEDSTSFPFDVVPRNKHFNSTLALMANKQHVDVKALGHAQWYVSIMEKLGEKEERGEKQSQDLPQTYRDPEEGDNGTSIDPPTVTEEERERVRISETSSAADIITYNTLLSIAARAKEPEKAEEILEEMIKKSADGASKVKEDTVSFNTVLLAWSKSKSAKAKFRTEEILQRMQEMADNGDTSVRPDRASLTTVINTIISSTKRNRSAPHQAEKIIERMEANKDSDLRPDVVTYTNLIKVWVESGHSRSADRAEEIINFLHRRYDEGYKECKPDTLVYNVAMNALAKSDKPGSAKRAEALLNRMQDHYYAGDSDLTPTTQSFSTVIQAYANSKDPKGAIKAEKLLQTMHDLEESGVGNVSPNTIAYSTVILAWRNSGGRDAGRCVDTLLNKMEQYEKKGLSSLKPNYISYTNAMEAWIGSRQPESLEKVEAILERMIERYEAGDTESAPTVTTFNVVMKAIMHSKLPAKHKKAQHLLDRMKEHGALIDKRVRPNQITYNTFFSACAWTSGSAETKATAFSMVLNALIEMQEHNHLRPDLYTWPAIWSACRELLDIKRDMARVNRIFDLTIKSGNVNEYLWNNLRNILPAQYLQRKLNTSDDIKQITVHDLPPEWTCNIKLGRNRQRGGKGPSKNNKAKVRRNASVSTT